MQNDTVSQYGKARLLGDFVLAKIQQMQNATNAAMSRANLARLRRGIGRQPGSMPDLWSLTIQGMPEALVGKGDRPSWGEWASYLSLTLYALHQQGRDLKSNSMHKPDQPLGMAVRMLAKGEDDLARVKRRFDRAVTADSPTELANHLRALIQLLRSDGTPLDYSALAQDLYRFQDPLLRDGVRLQWGRAFHRVDAQKAQEQLEESQSDKETNEEDTNDET